MTLSTYSYCSHCKAVNLVDSQKALNNQAVCGKCAQELQMQGLVTPVDEEGFHKILDKCDQLIAVDFWASWCGPCQMYGPIFEQVSKKFPGQVTFIKLNTEQSPHTAANLGIRGIPATLLFKQRKEVARLAGALNEEQLSNLLITHL